MNFMIRKGTRNEYDYLLICWLEICAFFSLQSRATTISLMRKFSYLGIGYPNILLLLNGTKTSNFSRDIHPAPSEPPSDLQADPLIKFDVDSKQLTIVHCVRGWHVGNVLPYLKDLTG